MVLLVCDFAVGPERPLTYLVGQADPGARGAARDHRRRRSRDGRAAQALDGDRRRASARPRSESSSSGSSASTSSSGRPRIRAGASRCPAAGRAAAAASGAQPDQPHPYTGSSTARDDAEFDALGMIPVVGDRLGVLSGGYDASIALGRAAGLDPENETPLSSDLYHKVPDMFQPQSNSRRGPSAGGWWRRCRCRRSGF